MTQNDLLARLSAAESGSRDLDAEMARACGWRIETRSGKHYGVAVWVRPDGVVFPSEPPLTNSYDAIVGEIERQGFGWAAFSIGGDGYVSTDGHVWDYQGRAKTPCLALCIALLKAKEANHDE